MTLVLPCLMAFSLAACSGLGDVLLGGSSLSTTRLGLGETVGLGARAGLCESDGSVCCFLSDLVSVEEVGGAMLPVELVFGRVKDLSEVK